MIRVRWWILPGIAALVAAVGLVLAWVFRGQPSGGQGGSGPWEWQKHPAQLEGGPLEVAVSSAKKEALSLAQELCRRFRDDAEALCIFGLVESRFGDRRRAVDAWKRALRLVPDYADAWYALGEEARLRGDFSEAITHFRRAVDTGKAEARVLLSLATLLIQEGRPAEALPYLEQYLGAVPQSIEGWYRLGQALRLQDRLPEAKQAWMQALRLDREHKTVLYALGEVCEKLGQHGEAERFRREFARLEARDRLNPQLRRTWYDDLAAAREGLAAAHVAVAKFLAVRGDWELAEAHYRRAAEVDPRNTAARIALLEWAAENARWQEALRWVEELAALQPTELEWALRRGAVLLQLGRLEEAQSAFLTATEIAPGRPEGYVALAQLMVYRNRDLEGARHWARRAVECAPSAANYHLLAIVCERQKDLEAAVAAAKRAVQLEPLNPEFRQTLARLLDRWQVVAARAEPSSANGD
jgi:tetratricopeptide (TPR) repeat protein